MLTQEKNFSNQKALNIEEIRKDFPVLGQTVRENKPLIYLDNAATTQKPRQVIDRIAEFYSHENATVRRGVYYLSEKSTAAYEGVRRKIAKFLNAPSENEIIFVRGCTEAINLVARSFGGSFLKEGDEIIISAMEHHANIVPWQMICQEKGAKLKVIPITEAGEIEIESFKNLINEKTKFVSINHVSNALGSINPIKKIVEIAHSYNIPVLVDGAQAAPHMKVDLQDLNCDFYTFSGHKIFGPTGIGVLYGKMEFLEKMPPYQGGGDMIETVTFEKTTFAPPPAKFEAGTPAIASAIGLGAAIDYVENLGIEKIEEYENQLLQYATKQLSEIKELSIIGNAREKASLISFTLQGIHPHDIGTILDQENGIAIRAGNHCAQPVMRFYGIPATARASFAFYNTEAEVDALVNGLRKVIEIFS